MAKLVTSADMARDNIRNFRDFIGDNTQLIDRLPYHRAWYAVSVNGSWHFGNSKIIGYTGLTPKAYLSGGYDGRQTERILQNWFEEVTPGDPLYEELWEALSDFLSEYEKHPSSLTRINILSSDAPAEGRPHADAISDLLFEVAKNLDAERIKILRKRLRTLL